MDSLDQREPRAEDEDKLGDSAVVTLDFFELYAGSVYAFFTRRGFTARQCLDFTQETFMGLDRQRDEETGERHEIRLFRLAAQIWFNATRGQADPPGRASASLAELEARRSGAAEAKLASPAWRRLREAVAALPGPQRRALFFEIDQELEGSQIAILLQVSLTTVQAHLRDARQRLHGMLGGDEPAALDEALRELVAETRRQLKKSSSAAIHVDNIVAYHGGALAEDERDRLQEWLAYSPPWSSLLLDLDRFPDVVPPSGIAPLDGEELLEQKRLLEKRLEDLEGPTRVLAFPASGSALSTEPAEGEGPVWSSRLIMLLLTAVIVGAGLWIAALHQRIDELSQPPWAPPLFEPMVNVATLELFPRPAGESGITARLPAAVPYVLVLNSLDRGAFADYRIDLVTTGGASERLAWRGSGFSRSPQSTFSLLLPPGFPGEGRYRIELYGLRGDTAQLIESFGEVLID